jgi:Mn-dependent DtxR family transcriptional regulator
LKDPLQIAKEDVMRFLREVDGSASRDSILDEIGEKEVAEKAIRDLASEGMISLKDNEVSLTEKGREVAEKLYRTHVMLENVLKDLVDRPHEAAHSIEHVVTDVEGLAALKGRVTMLSSLKRGEEARILTIIEKRPSTLSRLYGVGVLPGRKVRVLTITKNFVILLVGFGGRVVTLDREVADKIVVVKEGPNIAET